MRYTFSVSQLSNADTEPRPLRPAAAREREGHPAPSTHPIRAVIGRERAGGLVPSPLIHRGDASTSPILQHLGLGLMDYFKGPL